MFPFGCSTMLSAGPSGFNPSTPLGTAIEGGYFIGSQIDSGKTWALIYAPKATGQTSLAWGTTAATTLSARSNTNGFANSNSINNSNYPAAQFCRSLTIAGYNDWYLPAREEILKIYSNSSYIGGGDAIDIDAIRYWSSTDSDLAVGTSYSIRFSNGIESSSGQTSVNRVRAVRRVLIG